MQKKMPIKPSSVIAITEFLGSDKVELILKNNFRVAAFKSQFEDYAYYKNACSKKKDFSLRP